MGIMRYARVWAYRREIIMKKIDKSYCVLFNAITDAINLLEQNRIISPQTKKSLDILKNAQCKTEDMYINAQQ